MAKKILLGIASCGFILTFVPFWLGAIGTVLLAPDIRINEAFAISCIVLTGIASFATIGTVFYYLYKVNSDQQLNPERRAIWSLVLLTMGLVAAPVYWYFYVWNEPAGAAGSQGLNRDNSSGSPAEGHSSGQALCTIFKKILLGVASLSGLAASFAFALGILLGHYFGLGPFIICFVTMLVGGFILTGITAYYVYCVYRHPALSGEQKIMWTMILLSLAPVSCPVYWYYHIWRENQQERGSS
jgi:hypothetical protein